MTSASILSFKVSQIIYVTWRLDSSFQIK